MTQTGSPTPEQLPQMQPAAVAQAMQIGLTHHRAGRLQEAERSYRQVLETEPENPYALQLLGLIAHKTRNFAVAADLMKRAIGILPSNASFINDLGETYRGLARIAEAETCYRRAISLKPDFAEAHNNLGLALREKGVPDEAVASFIKALSFKPGLAEVHNNLGNALKDQGELERAITHYTQALSIKPDYAEAHSNLGNALKEQGRVDDAVTSYRKALASKPTLAEAHYNLGLGLQEQGELDEAVAHYGEALSLDPGYAEARWAIAMSQLPAVHGFEERPSASRAAFAAALTELDAWFCGDRVENGYKAVGSQQPFYLAYQEENNRDLLSQYGALCFRLMEHWQQRQGLVAARPEPSGIVKVGIVSGHFYSQSVWHALVEGWLRHLDRTRFELHLFYLGKAQDDATDFARIHATTFSQGSGGLKQRAETILERRPDILIYPEIGMDSMTVKLASLRLAPVQVASWGHPETTGLPSIDYYLSAEDFEPDNSQANYTERLIKLPNLGCCYPRAPVSAREPDLAALQLDPASPLLVCPGTPYKYAPQHDWVLVEIARRLGKCQFIFFTYRINNWSAMLRRRLQSVFGRAGLRCDDFVVFIPWQEKSAFYGLMRRADVYLDTIGFSGFNTAMQAVECSLPIVTREGRFMRGRLASGIFKRMGLSELVAATEDEYIEMTVKLVKDAAYRYDVRARIETSRQVLFEDLAPVRALEDFLQNAAKLG